MEDNKSTNVKKTVKSGITFGSALAMVISYTTWKSVGWAIFHGLLSWACIRNWQQRKTSIDFYGKLRLLMVK